MKLSLLLNLVGLALNLAGVLILFRYGMPYRVETAGKITLVTEQINKTEQAADKFYRRLGKIGLAFVVIGTLLQGAGACLS